VDPQYLEIDLLVLGFCAVALAWSFARPRTGPRWILAAQLLLFSSITAQDLAPRAHWSLALLFTLRHWVVLPLYLLLIVAGLLTLGRRGRTVTAPH